MVTTDFHFHTLAGNDNENHHVFDCNDDDSAERAMGVGLAANHSFISDWPFTIASAADQEFAMWKSAKSVCVSLVHPSTVQEQAKHFNFPIGD